MVGEIGGIKVRVLDIVAFHKRLKIAKKGEAVGLILEGIKKELIFIYLISFKNSSANFAVSAVLL